MAFATSIDAMATGLVFVSYPGTIMRATVTIALGTLLFAFSGMFIGVRFGRDSDSTWRYWADLS
jgi:putative Mn2+ efflux pump MntP